MCTLLEIYYSYIIITLSVFLILCANLSNVSLCSYYCCNIEVETKIKELVSLFMMMIIIMLTMTSKTYFYISKRKNKTKQLNWYLRRTDIHVCLFMLDHQLYIHLFIMERSMLQSNTYYSTTTMGFIQKKWNRLIEITLFTFSCISDVD